MLCESIQLPVIKADYPKCILTNSRTCQTPWSFSQVNPKLPHTTNVKFWIKMNKMARFHHKRTKLSLFWTDCCAERGSRMLRMLFKPHKLVLSHAINVSSTQLSRASWQGSASRQTPPAEKSPCSSDRNSETSTEWLVQLWQWIVSHYFQKPSKLTLSQVEEHRVLYWNR